MTHYYQKRVAFLRAKDVTEFLYQQQIKLKMSGLGKIIYLDFICNILNEHSLSGHD
jgi:hypothetical protein